MAQQFVVIADTDTLVTSRVSINNNFDAVASNFSGTDFPQLNLRIGQMCFRTDQNKLWLLKTITPTSWIPVINDVTQVQLSQAVADTLYHSQTGSTRAPLSLQVDAVTKIAKVNYFDNAGNTRYAVAYDETTGALSLDRYNASGSYLGPGLRIKSDGSVFAGGGVSGAPADGYKVWTEGNDGNGSGLDADKVRNVTPGTAGLAVLSAADANAAMIALGFGAGAAAQTGDVKMRFGNDDIPGWLRMNGLTIGRTGSAANARANDDTWPLFNLLWWYSDRMTVSGGKGASSINDWNAYKTITVPDMRGRAPFGLSAMGWYDAGVIGQDLTVGYRDYPGAYGGGDRITLTMNEIPWHNHGGGTTTAGNHTHTYAKEDYSGKGDGGPAYSPYNDVVYGVNTSSAGSHNHGIPAEGGSGAHNNMPPFMLFGFYIKL